MRNLTKPDMGTKMKMKKAKAKTWWKWNKAKGKTKMKWPQLRSRKTIDQAPWVGVAGGILGGLAGLATFFAVKKSMEENQENFPQSGQAPGRSHVQRSSHPAAESRFQALGRRFGKAQ